jgi:putative membrane protein
VGVTYAILFWIHMTSLAAGGVAAFGIPIVGARIGGAAPEMRPTLFHIAETMSNLGRVAIALLIITGPIMYWLAWSNGGPPNMTAFIAKMVFVVLLLITVIVAGINAKRAQAGDMAAAKRSPMLGMTAATLFVLVILSAALAFKL